jgi:uncharacterized secreted protein with C-terminal beta-propeller domain
MARQSIRTLLVAALLVGSVVGAGAAAALLGPTAPAAGPAPPGTNASDEALTDLSTFDSPAAFQAYVALGQRLSGPRDVSAGGGGDGAARETTAVDQGEADAAPRSTPVPAATEAGDDGPSRVGTTNVQVAALDEPDRVKTDGRHFYYAPSRPRVVREPAPTDDETATDVARPQKRPEHTAVIDASEPADPRAVANIDDNGQLLRTGEYLLVLGHDELTAYDVSDPETPEEAWSRPLDDRLVTARERNGTVYLVTRSAVHDDPCPIEPIGADAAVPCTDVHHPRGQIPVDATFSAFALEASSGDVRDSVSFVGTGRHTVVYMSTDALYVTYTATTDRASFMGEFLLEEFDRTPESVAERIREVRSYDISPDSTRREIQRAVRSWLGSLDADERERVERELREGFREYLASHQRDLARTGIVRVNVDGTDLRVGATESVPGRPLNQFSMDEHAGTLRVTTTIPGAGDAESVSDLYVLDADSLEGLGKETDMGEGQRVYAVRYVDDTAYVVTFRRVDPLHVVDLSDPQDPTEVGTLKLPGFSNYLHPIDEDHVLGIGEEDGRVKAVLFDVSDPGNPVVADDLKIDAGWSAVSETHHAFTIDRRHGVIFLPAGQDGHVLDYTNGTLERTHTVRTRGPAERARYVDDYLYVFARGELAVVDETDWSRATTLELAADT